MRKYINNKLIPLQYKLGVTRLYSYPQSATFELTNYCNLRCHVCDQQQVSARKFGMMRLEEFKTIIDEIGPYLRTVGFSDTGEAFINRDTQEIIKYTSKKFPEIYSSMDTNGHFIEPEILVNTGLKKISFSLDGMTQDTYSKYRVKGDFGKVCENLEKLIAVKKQRKSSIIIEIKFIVMKHNEHEIDSLRLYSQKIGVDSLRLETFTARAFENRVYNEKKSIDMANEFVSNLKQFNIYDLERSNKEGKLYSYHVQNRSACYVPWSETEILYNGDVRACVVDFDKEHGFGNIFEEGSFWNVWNSEKARKFRETHVKKKHRQEYESCSTCAITNYTEKRIAETRLNIATKHRIIPLKLSND